MVWVEMCIFLVTLLPSFLKKKSLMKGSLGLRGRDVSCRLVGRGERLQTYSMAVPWLIRSAKVSFIDFKLCVKSQSSESSQAEDNWVSSPCSLCKTESQKPVEREGDAEDVLGSLHVDP